jgi:alkylation response protein AidB-like acyl-CoA dehydrogenase
MDLDFSEEQQILRDMVRGVCDEFAPIADVRAMEDDPVGYSPVFWKQLAELGILGIQIPESQGGSGQTALETAIAYEEFGRSLAPSPHFVSSILAAGALLRAGSDELAQAWLPRIAAGEAIVTPAWLEPSRGQGPDGVVVAAREDAGDFVISGVKRHVAYASAADALLTLVRTGPQPRDIDLLLVDRDSPGLSLVQEKSLASDTQYRVVFDEVRVPGSQLLGPARSGWKTWDAVMHEGIVLLAAQAIGSARRAHEMTVAYALQREQFDKPLAAFQALAHDLSDTITKIDGGETLVYEAAWASAQGRSIARLAPMAKLFACRTFKETTKVAMQIHGGLGFTVEFDIQLYFRRAKQLEMSWWDARTLEKLIAADVLDR